MLCSSISLCSSSTAPRSQSQWPSFSPAPASSVSDRASTSASTEAFGSCMEAGLTMVGLKCSTLCASNAPSTKASGTPLSGKISCAASCNTMVSATASHTCARRRARRKYCSRRTSSIFALRTSCLPVANSTTKPSVRVAGGGGKVWMISLLFGCVSSAQLPAKKEGLLVRCAFLQHDHLAHQARRPKEHACRLADVLICWILSAAKHQVCQRWARHVDAIAQAESIATFFAHPHFAFLHAEACATWRRLADRLCSYVATVITFMSSGRRKLGRTGTLVSAASPSRPCLQSPRVQKPSISGMPRMLHRGGMQLLQRNARHRFCVMLDAQ